MKNPNEHEHLSPDLIGLAEALDRLGAAERAIAPAGLDTRVSDAALATRLGTTMEQMAEADRLSAPPRLEETIFEASRRELAGAEKPVLFTFRMGTMARVAAAILIVGAGALVYLSLGPTPLEQHHGRIGD